MLRISAGDSVDGSPILRLEGRIVGPWVEELRDACDRELGEGRSVTLDMGGVSFIDQSGLELVAELSQRSVAVIHCSAFLEEQLKLAL